MDTVNHVLDFQKLNFLKDEKIARIEAPPSPHEEISTIEEQPRTPTSTSPSTSEDNLFDNRAVDIDLSTVVQEVAEGVVLGYEFKDLSKVLGQSEDVKKAALQTPTKVSNIQVVVDIDELEGGWVFRSNPAAFKRIVGNIVGNAIKYSNEKGWIKITLTAKMIEPAPNGAPRAKVIFIVSDSGKGMSREFLKTRLFTPFTQENPMAPGSGLGLSIVRQLVDVLGGKIDVKSQSGKGTTFRIEMKLTQAPHSMKGISRTSSQLVLPKMLGKKAFLVGFERFDNPEDAEQRGQALLYDSVIRYLRDLLHMDVVSDPEAPDAKMCQFVLVNELAAAPQLHEMSILKDRPVVVMSNSTPRRSILESFRFDRDPRLVNLLRKPCGPRKLLRAFQVCLDISEKGLPELSPSQAPSLPPSIPGPSASIKSGLLPETTMADTNSAPQQCQTEPTQHHLPSGPSSTPPTISSQGSSAITPQIEKLTLSELPAPVPTPPIALAALAPPPPAEQSTQQPRILCVEDNKINMMLVTTYLKKKKYPFEMAFDGAEAFEKVKEAVVHGCSYDCILMDLRKSSHPISVNQDNYLLMTRNAHHVRRRINSRNPRPGA